jgi:hypothetical protein
MKCKLAGVLVSVLVLLGTAVSTFAHHGYGTEFDGTKCMDLKGTLSGIKWENPHAYFDMDVKNAKGDTANWHVELITPNALKRNGTTREDFLTNVGKAMVARVCPAKPEFGENRGAAEYIKLADGIIRTVGQLPERGITPEKLSFYNN